MKRQLLAVPMLATVALALGACSGGAVGGTPTPGPTTTDGGSSTSSNNTAGGDPLASVNPCSMFTAAQITQYQLSQSGKDSQNGARSCSWQGVQDGSSSGGEVDVDIYDHTGFNQLDHSQFSVSSFSLKQHQGYLEQDKTGGALCSVDIVVTSSSVVSIDGSSGNSGLDASCNIAKQFAPIIEQNLIALGH